MPRGSTPWPPKTKPAHEELSAMTSLPVNL